LRARGSDLVQHLEGPILKIEGAYECNFYYHNTSPMHFRKFIILKINNIGKKQATNCWATITLHNNNNETYPLHWVDTEYQFLRDSMIPIDILPQIPRELDVAFSVYGSYQPPENGLVLTSAPIYTNNDKILMMRGTLPTNIGYTWANKPECARAFSIILLFL
jgi:hypothetical protein